MKSALRLFSIRSYFRVFLAAVLVLGGPLLAQNANPEQTLAAMEKCREQVISGLSFSEKMKMKAAMAAIQNKPVLVAANSAVSSASTPQAQIEARKALSMVKLDLITRQDPSLKPVVDKIRAAQASLLK
jgi:hypothetical protein